HLSVKSVRIDVQALCQLDERWVSVIEPLHPILVALIAALPLPFENFRKDQPLHHTTSTPSSPVSPWLLWGVRPLPAGLCRFGFSSRPTTSPVRLPRPFRPVVSQVSDGAALMARSSSAAVNDAR